MTSITEIWGLQSALDSKAIKTHDHRIKDIKGLREALKTLEDQLAQLPTTQAHNVLLSDVQGLAEALDSKAAVGHIHAIANIQGLSAALDALALVAHNELASAITAVQSAIDAKAALNHSHATATSSAAGFMSAGDKSKLDGLGGSSQPTIADVQGLQSALDSKAPTAHSHAIADVGGLQTALDNKAAANHTHSGLPSLNPQPLVYTFTQSTVYQSNASYQGSYNNLNDGSYTTGAGTGSGSFEWLKADLGSVKSIARIAIGSGNPSGWGSTASYLNAATLEVSTDNSSWALLMPTISQIADNATTLFAFGAVACQYIRIRKSGFIGCTELKVYG